ncbi:MAG TPA: hypothetical protein VMH87_18455, partial [Pseudomonadales bacterium]|nr:hypothetical protein [Pseudomonadales bacterium]
MKTNQTIITLKTLVLAAGLGVTAYRGRCDVPVANNPGHWYAGTTNQNLGQLDEYTNGGNFTATSGYVYWLTYTNTQTGYLMTNGVTNYYFGSNPTFTALGNGTTSSDAGSNPAIAATNGALLAMQIVSLAGPPGGHYYFWDLNVTNSTHPVAMSAPAFTIAVGDAPTNDVFIVSDPSNGAGSPGGDPYGHMHGRRYAVDAPGTYTLGLQVIDLSTNGPNGGPLQTPSQIYYATYQAGQTIQSISVCNTVVSLTVPTVATAVNSHGNTTNAVYTLLETTNLVAPINWAPVGSNSLAGSLESNSVFGTG